MRREAAGKASRCRRFRFSASFLLARRQRSGAGKFFEQLSSFGVAGNLLYYLRLLIGHQRCRLIPAGEFTILIDEYEIRMSFSDGFLKNLHAILGSSGGRSRAV